MTRYKPLFIVELGGRDQEYCLSLESATDLLSSHFTQYSLVKDGYDWVVMVEGEKRAAIKRESAR